MQLTDKLCRSHVKAGIVHALPLFFSAPYTFWADAHDRHFARFNVAPAHEGSFDRGTLLDVDSDKSALAYLIG
jgi:hypothetical protein